MAKKKAKVIQWRDRYTETITVRADEVLPHPANPKIHPDNQKNALTGLLDEVGKLDALKAYRSEAAGGQLVYFDGHCRADLRPDELWRVDLFDLTDEEVALVLVTFDPIGWQAEQSRQRLEGLMETIRAKNSHVVEFLAEQGARMGLVNQLNGYQGEPQDAEPQIDRAAELNKKWKVKTGDLWLIGEHRLLCGDSTKAEDVARVMDGEKAQMMFTDPPYGVSYEGGHFHSGDVNIKRKREELEGDQDTAIYTDFLPVALAVVDGPCYMWFAGSKARDVYNAIFDAGCELHALIIWHKTNATYAAMNAQYKQRHEPCLYFKPKGSTLRWCGLSTEATVWSEDRDGINDHHPTQKPITLATKAIRNHEAATVLDAFAGSGSTMVAAQNLNRKCFALEISPNYCAVILERMQAAFPDLNIRRGDKKLVKAARK